VSFRQFASQFCSRTGIGFATAKRFADEGAHVFITGRRVPELRSAAKEIGGNVTTIDGDIANLDDLGRVIDTTFDTNADRQFP
jgi:NADP-dependent 3-hydroxy acid dehydrogenase YdfG